MAKDIVMLRGASEGGWCFDKFRGVFEGLGWTCHAPDLIGHGKDKAGSMGAVLTQQLAASGLACALILVSPAPRSIRMRCIAQSSASPAPTTTSFRLKPRGATLHHIATRPSEQSLAMDKCFRPAPETSPAPSRAGSRLKALHHLATR